MQLLVSCLVEVTSPGCVVDCKFGVDVCCRCRILSSGIVGSTKLAVARYYVSGLRE
jgi:hypothetical protein